MTLTSLGDSELLDIVRPLAEHTEASWNDKDYDAFCRYLILEDAHRRLFIPCLSTKVPAPDDGVDRIALPALYDMTSNQGWSRAFEGEGRAVTREPWLDPFRQRQLLPARLAPRP